MQLIITQDLVQKVLSTVDAGLTKGKGKPIPGQMCVEAAVNYALGRPHGDAPDCVGKAVRSFKIQLNDSRWSSDTARAAGMRKLAVAQLGSNTLDQVEFSKKLAFLTVTKFLPPVLRKAGLEAEAKACEAAENLMAATAAADAARAAAATAAATAARAAAATAAAYAAYAAARAAADAADRILISMAELGLEVLKEMKSPGCEWLCLCDSTAGVV